MPERTIKLEITRNNLRDENTAEDNERCRAAVQKKIQARFPRAAVTVTVIANTYKGQNVATARGFGADNEETEETARGLAADAIDDAQSKLAARRAPPMRAPMRAAPPKKSPARSRRP